jgi:hypothetical protein
MRKTFDNRLGKKSLIFAPDKPNPALFLHEVGHARSPLKSIIPIAGVINTSAPNIASAWFLYKSFTASIDEDVSATDIGIGLVSPVLTTLRFAEETQASLFALKALKELGKETVNSKKMLGLALSTYAHTLPLSILPFASYVGVQSTKRWWVDRQEEKGSIKALPQQGMALQSRELITNSVSSASPETKNKFNFFTQSLNKYGVFTGTAHRRILIPKASLSLQEMESLGFVPVSVAIPEAGQKSITSYRNINNNYHIHEFESTWSLHEDEHTSSTMRIKKKEMQGKDLSPIDYITETARGLPHLITEGLPGLYFYTTGLLSPFTVPMDQRLQRELPREYLNKVKSFF